MRSKTRPTGPRPWPNAAEHARQSVIETLAEIARLVRSVKSSQTDMRTSRVLAEIEACAEHGQLLLVQARRNPVEVVDDSKVIALEGTMAEILTRLAALEGCIATLAQDDS